MSEILRRKHFYIFFWILFEEMEEHDVGRKDFLWV